MIELLPFSLCLFAFNCFALAKINHFKDVFKRRPSKLQQQAFLFAAWISILLSFMFCVITQQGYGVLLFCGFMSLSVLIIMTLHNFLIHLVSLFSVFNLALIIISAVILGFF